MAERHRDKPWIFRTYAGYGNARVTNERYRRNLAKGQTGLSIAFDLPTQTGYDSDHEMARGEVGRVGVPITSLGDMRDVFDGIPLQDMNTSMTINATAVWLYALYVAVADEHEADRSGLTGTTQNDMLKEFLARGTYAFPPEPSMRLTVDLIAWALRETPRWNPINVCSYHLQEAGADPVLEVAFTLANAFAVLDACRDSGQVADDDIPALVGRISFFCNAGIRFVEETAKMRAFARLWDRLTRERYGVEDPKMRRFRYGVQVNSLGLTALQPENNVYRILLEMLAVTMSRGRPGTGGAAPGVERGARAAAGVGPAVVAAGAADPGRTRPTCWSTAICSRARRSWSRSPTRSRPAPRRSSAGCWSAAVRWKRSAT